MIKNGYTYQDGKKIPNMVEGNVIVNEICKENLPTQGGFFFGSTDYDEWYLEAQKFFNTINEVIEEQEAID